MQLTGQTAALIEQLEEYFKGLFLDKIPSSLYEAMYYPIACGGKRLRPQFCFLACEVAGGNPEQAFYSAAALELLHTFTLVHDDIMDHDALRRGYPTVHQKWDESTAILAGDGLVTLAYQNLLKTVHPRIIPVMTLFTEGLLTLCEGQALDKEFEKKSYVALEEYNIMIAKKTGKLIEVSCEIGATLGSENPQTIHTIREFAVHLGRAFQIQDDLLDLYSEEKITGKPVGSDLVEKKKTFLIIHFQNSAPSSLKSQFDSIWEKSNLSAYDVADIKNLFEKSGTFKEARTQVQNLIQQGLDCLHPLKNSSAKEALCNFAVTIRDRIS